MISLYKAMGNSLFDDSCWPQHSSRPVASSCTHLTVTVAHGSYAPALQGWKKP